MRTFLIVILLALLVNGGSAFSLRFVPSHHHSKTALQAVSDRRLFLATAVTTALVLAGDQQTAHATVDCSVGGPPCFEGNVMTVWEAVKGRKDHNMLLTKDFTFVDANGDRWTAPAGYEIDGASIPSPFWTIIGSPYVGDYRRASVVHDYYCEKEKANYSAEKVHEAFYEAMLVDEVPQWKAWLMYKGVSLFSRW